MATETIVKCDITGKVIEEGKKFDRNEELPISMATGGMNVRIELPDDVDVDRDALLSAIGKLATKTTRERKKPEVPATPPPGEPEAPKAGKPKKDDGDPPQA